MANIGAFDAELRALAWFDTIEVVEGWFDYGMPFDHPLIGLGVTAVVSGTITAGTTEADIVAGGKTIIITLSGDTWIAAGAGSFDLQRDEILQGLDSAQSEALGWNLQVRDTELLTAVVRTSDTVVTITLTAHLLYDITAQETITVTVPGTAVVGGVAITATPTFTVSTAGGSWPGWIQSMGGWV